MGKIVRILSSRKKIKNLKEHANLLGVVEELETIKKMLAMKPLIDRIKEKDEEQSGKKKKDKKKKKKKSKEEEDDGEEDETAEEQGEQSAPFTNPYPLVGETLASAIYVLIYLLFFRNNRMRSHDERNPSKPFIHQFMRQFTEK